MIVLEIIGLSIGCGLGGFLIAQFLLRVMGIDP